MAQILHKILNKQVILLSIIICLLFMVSKPTVIMPSTSTDESADKYSDMIAVLGFLDCAWTRTLL